MSKLDEVYDSLARNVRFRHYDIKVVIVPHEHARMLNRKYFDQKAAISADRRLINEGKDAAIRKGQGEAGRGDQRVARRTRQEHRCRSAATTGGADHTDRHARPAPRRGDRPK